MFYKKIFLTDYLVDTGGGRNLALFPYLTAPNLKAGFFFNLRYGSCFLNKKGPISCHDPVRAFQKN